MQFASASVALAFALATACSVTSPRPLPPPRIVSHSSTIPIAPTPDLPQRTRPPLQHDRYMHWTLPLDILASVPLVKWIGNPEDTYLIAPSLLVAPTIHLLHGESESAALSLVAHGAMVGGVYLAKHMAETECADAEFLCLPFGSIMIASASITAVILVDSLFLAQRTREVSEWRRLPLVPSFSVAADGRRSFVLSGEF